MSASQSMDGNLQGFGSFFPSNRAQEALAGGEGFGFSNDVFAICDTDDTDNSAEEPGSSVFNTEDQENISDFLNCAPGMAFSQAGLKPLGSLSGNSNTSATNSSFGSKDIFSQSSPTERANKRNERHTDDKRTDPAKDTRDSKLQLLSDIQNTSSLSSQSRMEKAGPHKAQESLDNEPLKKAADHKVDNRALVKHSTGDSRKKEYEIDYARLAKVSFSPDKHVLSFHKLSSPRTLGKYHRSVGSKAEHVHPKQTHSSSTSFITPSGSAGLLQRNRPKKYEVSLDDASSDGSITDDSLREYHHQPEKPASGRSQQPQISGYAHEHSPKVSSGLRNPYLTDTTNESSATEPFDTTEEEEWDDVNEPDIGAGMAKQEAYEPPKHFLLDPRLPYVLSAYLQTFFNVLLLSIFVYFFYIMVSTVRSDVGQKIEEYSADVLAEMSSCTKEYMRNNCMPGKRVPALEHSCNAWERCMNQDPALVGRAKVGAETFAEIINGFIEPISYKALVFILILSAGSFAMNNLAFGPKLEGLRKQSKKSKSSSKRSPRKESRTPMGQSAGMIAYSTPIYGASAYNTTPMQGGPYGMPYFSVPRVSGYRGSRSTRRKRF